MGDLVCLFEKLPERPVAVKSAYRDRIGIPFADVSVEQVIDAIEIVRKLEIGVVKDDVGHQFLWREMVLGEMVEVSHTFLF